MAPWPQNFGLPEVFRDSLETNLEVFEVRFRNRLDLTQVFIFTLGYKKVEIVSKESDPTTGFYK